MKKPYIYILVYDLERGIAKERWSNYNLIEFVKI